ncbi:MAG: ABC transporter ATP-binding protein [Chitinophagales bacterium]
MIEANVLNVKNLSKIFISGSKELKVLDNVNFEVAAGDSIAIVGTSGSGKTTLLGLCAGLDHASSGSVELNGISLNGLNEDERAMVRNQHVGFIFQNFNLMPGLTALENVMIPMELKGEKQAQEKALALLDKVGLGDRANHYPTQLSGGEQQRVSIARAFSNNPTILFADEPTGNLDEETGATIESLIFELNRANNTTLVIVTHDMALAKKTNRILTMKRGEIYEA